MNDALIEAVLSHDLDTVEFLINNVNVDINVRFMDAWDMRDISKKHGATVLHLAVRQNDLDIMRILIEAGADVNLKNTCSPLHTAVRLFMML